MVRQED
jgi:hypothetical protein